LLQNRLSDSEFEFANFQDNALAHFLSKTRDEPSDCHSFTRSLRVDTSSDVEVRRRCLDERVTGARLVARPPV
jgi:hypothetical protein